MESVKEAKAICAHSIQEAKTHCSTAIREAEAQRAAQAGSLQQSYYKTIQCLEEDSIGKERKGQLNFLSDCQTVLHASHPELHSVLVASYHVLLGHTPLSHLFSVPQGAPPFPPGYGSRISYSFVLEDSPRPKQQHHSPDPMDASPLGGAMSQATPKGPSTSKWQEIMPLHKTLTRSHQEVFSQDSSLVNEMR